MTTNRLRAEMTPEELKAGGRRLVEELFNQGDLSVADQLIDPRYTEHSVAEQAHYVGVNNVKDFVTRVRRAFPDICCRIDDQIVEGDRLVQRLTVVGRHAGRPFMGIPGDGSPVEISLVGILRIGPDGKVLEGWTHVDQLSLLRQLKARVPP